jgi:class 3 adenylate cyclase
MTEPARPYPGTAPAASADPVIEDGTKPTEPLSLPDLALRSIGSAVAIADPSTWEILFENGLFFEWFGPDAETDAPVGARIEGLDLEAVAAKLEKGRRFTWETDVTSGARTITTEIEIRRIKHEERELALVEARNISKRKEAEYLLDSYSRMAEKNARDLQREKERAEKLLLNIMPRAVYEELRDYGSTTPQRFESASVLLLDFVGFTDMAIANDPTSTIAELNDIFSAFDRIVELYGCERLKTMGDAYMAVSGLPEANPDHAANLAKVALRMRRYIDRRNAAHSEAWRCRIGLHSGPIIGSVVGVQKYVYDIFGPGVNMAARMETLADPMQIVISEATWALVRDEFACSDLGEVEVKGFGTQHIYSLDSESSGRFT